MRTHRSAIVYHYFAHYRLPIFKELMKSKNVEYVMFSSKTSGNDIKTIDPDLKNKLIEEGGLRWSFFKNIWLYKDIILWQRGFISMALKSDFDSYILLGNTYFITTWIAALILKSRKKKVYFWSHGVTSDEKGLKWSIRKTFYNLSNGIMLYGHGAKNIMAKNGIDKNKLYVIYNSLNYNSQLINRSKITSLDRNALRKKFFNNPEIPILVFVGRLTMHKKLNQIIEAVNILENNDFKVNTLFIGDGVAKPALEKLVEKHNLQERFHFFGPCYEESALSELLYSSDVCVSPGEVGLTAITSLGYGTPVITHGDFNYQMPEFEAVIPGVNGALFERDSPFDLAKVIREWIEQHKHVSGEELREACFTVVDEKYNPKNQSRIIEEILLSNE